MNREIKFRFDWLLWFLILLPTFYVVNKDLRHAQMNFFQISIFLMLALTHVNRWIGLFLGWSVFQFVFFPDMEGQAVVVQNIFFGSLLYHFVVKYAGNLKKYFWALFGVLALSTLWSLLQKFQIDPIFSPSTPELQTIFSDLSGFFALPAFFGNYAAAVFPLCVFLNPLLGLLVIPAMMISKSSFSILAVLMGLLFILWYKRRIFFWIALVLSLLIGSFYIVKYDSPSGQFSRRFKAWHLILREGFRKQFFGHGLSSYGNEYGFFECVQNHKMAMIRDGKQLGEFVISQAVEMKIEPVVQYMIDRRGKIINMIELQNFANKNGLGFEPWGQCHNEFLEVFFELGLLGLFLLLGFIFNIFKRFHAIKHKDYELIVLMASFISICVISFAHFPFQVARLAGPFIVIVAFLETKLLRYEGE